MVRLRTTHEGVNVVADLRKQANLPGFLEGHQVPINPRLCRGTKKATPEEVALDGNAGCQL